MVIVEHESRARELGHRVYGRIMAVRTNHNGKGKQDPNLYVNGIPHQSMVDADETAMKVLHGQVYRWFPDRAFDNVLIIGAGSGTDTAVALAHGAGHVDAVEIDAHLQEIGIRSHPNRPAGRSTLNAWLNVWRLVFPPPTTPPRPKCR